MTNMENIAIFGGRRAGKTLAINSAAAELALMAATSIPGITLRQVSSAEEIADAKEARRKATSFWMPHRAEPKRARKDAHRERMADKRKDRKHAAATALSNAHKRRARYILKALENYPNQPATKRIVSHVAELVRLNVSVPKKFKNLVR